MRSKLLMAVLCLALPAAAASAKEPDFFTIGGGLYGIRSGTTGQFQGEFRSGWQLFYIRPVIGAMGTTDRASFVYAGFLFDVNLSKHWVITPEFTPGWYNDGHGKRLGNKVEFRTQIEGAYRFDDHARLGLGFSHISNAGMGKKNPGEESLVINYSIPLSAVIDGD